MNILIYSPANKRSPDQQAQAELLISMGHNVILLTLAPYGQLHKNFILLGAEAFSSAHKKGRSAFFFLIQALHLIWFCRKHKIDVVFSNLQSNALITGLAKPLIKAKTFYFRHNADYYTLRQSTKHTFINKVANKLSPAIIAISDNVRTELIKEGVKPDKILRINLCYNFNNYLLKEITGNAEAIRKRSGSGFILLCIARLDALKRHEMAFEIIKKINEMGYYCSLICIGDGDRRAQLQNWITSNNMHEKIFIEGAVENVSDYIIATNMQLLLSYSEASNQSIKEGAFFKKPAIVCCGVGDFESYIIHNHNSYLVDKENPVLETLKLLSYLIPNKEELVIKGSLLYTTVIKKFSLDNVRPQYQQLLQNFYGY
jgi:glycosyltransferase involved in cell wall biosynthesis